MLKLTLSLVLATASFCAASMTAQAGELRFGVMQHDVEIAGLGGVREKESSQALVLDYRFDELDIFWSPKPYVGGSLNLAGKTSHYGAGLAWTKGFSDNFYGDFSFGLAGHTGSVRVLNPIDTHEDLAGQPVDVIIAEINRRFAVKKDTIEFGSEILFRSQFAVGYTLSDDWAAEFVYEHLSHGQILGGPENEGLDSAGLRLARKF
ncbi:MAG: acyloxyacyl hydrolase [Robiginitomaculum sp.]